MISFYRIYLRLAHCPVKIAIFGGAGRVPEICFSLKSSYFCYLGTHAKFHGPSYLLSSRKERALERKKEEEDEKCQVLWPQRCAGARTPLGPKTAYFKLFSICVLHPGSNTVEKTSNQRTTT